MATTWTCCGGTLPDESVDLVYLDPPFKSDQNYNVLFQEQDGSRSASQIRAFEDTWQWDQSAAAAFEEVVEAGGQVSLAMQAFRTVLGESDMLAYLSMMAPRLKELHRVLKPTGSIYLHCDPTASHYLKVLMDAVFGPGNFRNEIIWKRTNAHNDFQAIRAELSIFILFYGKTDTVHVESPSIPHDDEYIAAQITRIEDTDGRRYRLSDMTSPHPRYAKVMYEWTWRDTTYRPRRIGRRDTRRQ